MVRFGVLGPVVADNAQGSVPLGPARQRAVLAVLLVELNTVVPADQLVDRVWGQTPPGRPRETLQAYLSKLRSVLDRAGAPGLGRSGRGYLLERDPDTVDLHRFRARSAGARAATDDRSAAALWQDALTLWRGTPFGGLDSDWLHTVGAALEAERLAALLDRNDLLLHLGEHARLLPELSSATAAYPLDERLAGQLVLALYRSGRQADALAHYRQLHDRLVEELGSDPGPALQELHHRILRQDPELTATPAAEVSRVGEVATEARITRPGPRPHPRPAQLPADVGGVTGRVTDLRQLDALIAETGRADPMVIAAICGTAGVGKTALAVRWAHQLADRYPDGQLYVNLRGYDPEQPMAPAEALARFLTALGVADQDIPLELDDRAVRYRSELAGRRMMIVLDNAAGVGQVRPLLPGSGSCAVVVTSRDSLAGLVALHGAHRLDLDLLPDSDALTLLRQLIGTRVDFEPDAAATLARQCVRLPLALRVAAELAISRPEAALTDLVTELGDRQSRLELLDGGGDPHAAVATVLSWSVQQLPEAVVRTFRLLGLHPGPELDAHAAAALADIELDQARRALDRLARAYLVQPTGPGRCTMHDLLRAYAARLTEETDTDEQRRAALDRLFGYYLATAGSAMDLLYPAESHRRPPVPPSGTPVPDLTGPDAAQSWLDTERASLLAVLAHTADHGWPDHAARLSRILHRYYDNGHVIEGLAAYGHALRGAERSGDIVGRAYALRHLGVTHNRLGRFPTAVEHFQPALALFREAGDQIGEALTLTGLGVTRYRLGSHHTAIDHHQQAFALFQVAGDEAGEAQALTNLGVVEERIGRLEASIAHQRQALARFRRLGYRYGELVTLNNLGNVERQLNHWEEAAEHHHRALALCERYGNPIDEANVLDALGILHIQRQEPAEATGYLQRALVLYRKSGEQAGQAWARNGLGEAALLAGRPADAVGHLHDALALATGNGARHQQARAHSGLGQAHLALGDPGCARTHYQHAFNLYHDLHMPEAEEMRQHLAALGQESPLAGQVLPHRTS